MTADLLIVLGAPVVIVLALVALVTGAVEAGFLRIRDALVQAHRRIRDARHGDTEPNRTNPPHDSG